MQLVQHAGEPGENVAILRLECDQKVVDVLPERNGLQRRLKATISQLSGVCNRLTVVHERLEQRRGGWAASHFRLEPLLSSSVSDLSMRSPA